MEWTYIDDVLVDVVESETPTFSNEITEKPVEDGGVIADHINNKQIQKDLLPKIKEIVSTEKNNGVKNVYLKALRRLERIN